MFKNIKRLRKKIQFSSKYKRKLQNRFDLRGKTKILQEFIHQKKKRIK